MGPVLCKCWPAKGYGSLETVLVCGMVEISGCVSLGVSKI